MHGVTVERFRQINTAWKSSAEMDTFQRVTMPSLRLSEGIDLSGVKGEEEEIWRL